MGKWGTILVLLEEQQKNIETLQKSVFIANSALSKNASIPVKNGIAKAQEHMGSMRSTGLALKLARDSLDKELSETRLSTRVRRQRESLGNTVNNPPSAPRSKKRGASKTPEESTLKRGVTRPRKSLPPLSKAWRCR